MLSDCFDNLKYITKYKFFGRILIGVEKTLHGFPCVINISKNARF